MTRPPENHFMETEENSDINERSSLYPSQYSLQFLNSAEKTAQRKRSARHRAKTQNSEAAEPDAQADAAPPEKPEAVAGEASAAAEETPGSDEGKTSEGKRMLFIVGIFVCLTVLIISGTMLARYFLNIFRANTATQSFREMYQTAAPTFTPSPLPSDDLPPTVSPAPAVAASQPENSTVTFLEAWPKRIPGNEQLRIQERFTPLRQQNRDIVGWLSIDGVLDEPVFQRDNTYYLTHDANGKKNPTGALFLDENCNLRTVPMQTVIHGHNMKEGAMFGSLKKYKVKDASFYREHPYIQFDSLYENATYVIFSVAEISVTPGQTHYFPFWQQFNFPDYNSFHHYVTLAKEYSRYKVDIDVLPGDRLLTLATCSSDDDDLRLIVMARMLRPGEDPVRLANQILSATAK